MRQKVVCCEDVYIYIVTEFAKVLSHCSIFNDSELPLLLLLNSVKNLRQPIPKSKLKIGFLHRSCTHANDTKSIFVSVLGVCFRNKLWITEQEISRRSRSRPP